MRKIIIISILIFIPVNIIQAQEVLSLTEVIQQARDAQAKQTAIKKTEKAILQNSQTDNSNKEENINNTSILNSKETICQPEKVVAE